MSLRNNPLINEDNPAETVSNCWKVLKVIQTLTSDASNTSPFGQFLIMQSVIYALMYTEKELGPQNWDNDVASGTNHSA